MQEVCLLARFSLGNNNYCVCACKSVNLVQEQLQVVCEFRLLKVNNKKHIDRRNVHEMHDISRILF